MRCEIRLKPASSFAAAALFAIVLSSGPVRAQGTLADYQRAQGLQAKARGLVINDPGSPNWIGNSDHFWYYKSVKGGYEFILVDATTATKKPAFDHEKLAVAINAASGGKYTALNLPFAPQAGGRGGGGGGGRGVGPAPGALTFTDIEQAIEFGAAGFMYKCTLTDYKCIKGTAIAQPAAGGRGGRGGAPGDESLIVDDLLAAPMEVGGDPVDGLEYVAPPPLQGGGQGGGLGPGQPGCALRPQTQTAAQGQGRGAGAGGGGRGAGGQAAAESQVCGSFDGKWDALIQNFNVFLRPAGSNQPATPLSFDGSEGNYYTFRSIAWSPDSKKLVAYHTRPGYRREVHYIESAPADQLQPKHSINVYAKPGDALDIACPALFDVGTKKEIEIDNALLPNAYDITTPVWWKDGRGFTFEYNQRGHQVYRVIEVDAQTGKARTLIEEVSSTFIDYRPLTAGLSDTGKKVRRDLNDGKEIIWASERDGWEHLYLYDGVTGRVKNQITKGNWVVRSVDRVDEDTRQIWFQAAGMNPGQDPYFTHYYRINFDGTNLTKFADADGNHTVRFSPENKYYVDSWSRVDMPTVAQLRGTEDQKVIMDLEKGDASALVAAGFKIPEVFVAKGRDGKTDIWGTIVRPTNFDPVEEVSRH